MTSHLTYAEPTHWLWRTNTRVGQVCQFCCLLISPWLRAIRYVTPHNLLQENCRLTNTKISTPNVKELMGSFYWKYRHKFPNFSESLIFLQELNVVFLGLKSIDKEAFCGLNGISSIMLECNKLELPPDLTPVKPNLRKLSLMSDFIKWFPNNYFRGFSRLRFIDLADNKLAFVPNLNWPGVRESLLALNLKCNYIEIIDFLFAKD